MVEENTSTAADLTDEQHAQIKAVLAKQEQPADNADEPQIPRSKMNALNDKLRTSVELNVSYETRLKELETAEKTRNEEASILAGKSSDVIAARDTTITNLEGQLNEAKLKATRFRIATSKGLPPELADVVTGNDAEEIARNVDGIMASVNKLTGGAGFADGGRRPASGSIVSDKEKRERSRAHVNYKVA